MPRARSSTRAERVPVTPNNQTASTPRNRRVTISLDPTAPSTPAAEAAVKARNLERAARGGHDGLCVRTYEQAHMSPAGNAPTGAQTPQFCHCLCVACWDRANSRCVCSRCKCRPPSLLVLSGYSASGSRSRLNRDLPQFAFSG